MSSTPKATIGNRGQRRAMRPLAQDRPGEQPDHDDLRVAEHRRKAGSDLLDAVVPQDEVGCEEGARNPRERDGTLLGGPYRRVSRRASSHRAAARRKQR
jgi:hypothetical protein